MVLWWIANAVVVVVVVPLVILLANQVIRAGVEIDRYADDVLVHGVAVTANLEPVPALLQTKDLVAEVTANAVRYVTALDGLV